MKGEAAATEAADVASLVADHASLRDRHLRALAELENTRRRSERMADEARDYAITDFARELLQVIDNLQRAVGAAEAGLEPSTGHAPVVDGIRATEDMLSRTLERFGISRIQALGARFDPALHEAVMEVDTAQGEPGTIAEVLEEGYTIKDRLLRPARVVVVKRRPASSPAEHKSAGFAERTRR
jgi:molecular chaperone GrpE